MENKIIRISNKDNKKQLSRKLSKNSLINSSVKLKSFNKLTKNYKNKITNKQNRLKWQTTKIINTK